MTTNAPSGPATVQPRQLPPGTALIAIDLSTTHERKILYDQRIICGWNCDKIQKWADSMAAGNRSFFWICLPPDHGDTQSLPTIARDDKTYLPVGHVSLDKVDINEPDVEPDTTLANPDQGVLTITSLFVLPAYKRLGLGAFAMDECERLARVPPYGSASCVAVTVNTLSPRYCIGGEPGPYGLGMWEREGTGREIPPNLTLWYGKRGYVEYKEAIRYFGKDTKGEKTEWYACFMKKPLV